MRPDLALIIEPQELLEVIDNPDLLIIDVSQPQTYAQIHLPGAVHVQPAELVSGTPPATGKLPPVERLQALFSRIGYRPEQHIVVYDDEGGGWAGRFIWTLDVIGHQHYSYLNGGMHSWYREEFPTTDKVPSPEPSQVDITINDRVIATVESILGGLNLDNVKIWDARAREEYEGSKVTASRNGHIPGAVNLDWLDTMDRNRHLRLLPLDTLREKLEALGIRPNDRIITHCQSHHRSGLTYLVAKALGHEVQAYDGSWSEWGNLPDTPVEV